MAVNSAKEELELKCHISATFMCARDGRCALVRSSRCYSRIWREVPTLLCVQPKILSQQAKAPEASLSPASRDLQQLHVRLVTSPSAPFK